MPRHVEPTRDAVHAAALAALLPPGQVVELRAPNAEVGRGYTATLSGFYDDAAKMVNDAKVITAGGVYFTINPVNPPLLARRKNRLKQLGKKDASAADKDIVARHWLFVEVDPVRPSGICATEGEKAEAGAVADAVAVHLRETGWPDPVVIDSGNGCYLLYRIDLPTDDGGLVERCLKALATRFDTPTAHIDTSVFNPARIIRLPGTTNRKGDSTADRPHRPCRVLSVPDDVRAVPATLLEALAAAAPVAGEKGKRAAANGGTGGSARRLLVPQYLAHLGIEVLSTSEDDGLKRWRMTCPFNPDHTDTDSYVFQYADGGHGFHCSHNSCGGNKWDQFKAKVGKPQPDHYDPPMTRGRSAVSGQGDDRRHSADSTHSGHAQRNGKYEPPAVELVTRTAAGITAKETEFLWPDRLVFGMLNEIIGDPGDGKSTLTAEITARATKGLAFPPLSGVCRDPLGVLFLNAEDSAEHTTVRRLRAAGADLNRVEVLDCVRVGDTRGPLTLPAHLPLVRAKVKAMKAGVVILDPFNAFIGAAIDANSDKDVRSALLYPLKDLAEETGAAVILVRHLNKGVGKAVYRGGGSIAFTGAVRVSLATGKTPDGKNYLACVKSNVGPKPKAIEFRIEQGDEGSRVAWGDEADMDADDLFTPPVAGRGERTEAAEQFLREALAKGPVSVGNEEKPAPDSLRCLAFKRGLSWRTVERAKVKLGVLSSKGAFRGPSVWSLPPTEEEAEEEF